MYNPYNAYPHPQSFYNQQVQNQQNFLPQQQVIQVNGKASVDTIQLAPNSSILLMDTSAPIVWLCVSDGVGKVTATPYDITLHQEKPPVDVSTIETRVTKIEEMIKGLEEKVNAKSNVKPARTKPDGTDKEHD